MQKEAVRQVPAREDAEMQKTCDECGPLPPSPPPSPSPPETDCAGLADKKCKITKMVKKCEKKPPKSMKKCQKKCKQDAKKKKKLCEKTCCELGF